MTRAALAFALLALCLLPVSARADATAPDMRPSYAGRFEFAGGDRERRAKEAAIERATDDLFFLIRGIARSRLRDRTEIAAWVRFEFPKGRIKATVPGLKPALSPDNGAPARFTIDDETVELRQYFAGSHLVQRFKAKDGTRINDYVLDDEGRLILHVTIQSPKLPSPLRYTLTYRR